MTQRHIKVVIPDKEGQLLFTFSRGGPRVGAGRKAIGVTKKVSLTLPNDTWDEIEKLCADNDCSRSELLRGVIESVLGQRGQAHPGDEAASASEQG